MAETDAEKEVATVVEMDEKCGLDTNSHHNLPNPECNGINHQHEANDFENSYVFVTGTGTATGTDGLLDDAVDNKDVAAEDSSVLPQSKSAGIVDQGAEFDSQNEKLNAVGGEVNEPLNEGENGSIKCGSEDQSAVSTWKQESCLEDGERVQDAVADSLVENSEKIGNLTEVEVKQVENPGFKVKSLGEAELEKIGDQNGTIESAPEGKKEKFEDIKKSESHPRPVENQETEVEAMELAAESREKGELDNTSLHLKGPGNANDKCEAQMNLNAVEALEACQESLDVVELNLQDASMGAEDEVKLTREAVEIAEQEFPPSTSLNSNLELNATKEETAEEEEKATLSFGVLENQQCDAAVGNNVQDVLEQIDEAKAVASSNDCHVGNQESQDGVLGLVAESAERGQLDNISSYLNGSGNADDKCEDPINLNGIEALEICPGSQVAVVDVVELKLSDVSVRAEDDDVKLTREVVETVEHEFSPSTSLHLDLDTYPAKEEIPKEEANTTLGLDVPEKQQCDTALGNNIAGVPEQIDDAKAVANSNDSHVKTIDALVLEGKNEDFFDSHVNNGGQSPEEPDKNSDSSSISSETMQPETQAEASVPTQNIAAYSTHVPQTDIEISNTEAIGAFSSSLVDGPKSEITVQILSSHPEIGCSDAGATMAVSSSLVDGPKSEVTEKGLPSHPEIECSDAETNGAVSSLVDGTKSEVTEKGLPGHPEIECSDAEAIGAVSSSLHDGPESEIIEKKLPNHDSWIRSATNEESSGSDSTKSEVTEKGLPGHPEIECSDAEAIGAVSSSPHDGPESEIIEKKLPNHDSWIRSATNEDSSGSDSTKSEVTEKGLTGHPEIECSDAEATGAVSSSLHDGPESEIIEKKLPNYDSWIRSATNEESSGSDSTPDTVVLTEKKPTLQGGEAHASTKVSIGEATAADTPTATFDMKIEPEVSVHNFPATSSGEKTDDVSVTCRNEVLDSSTINEDSEANIVEIQDVEDKGDRLDGSAGSSNENLFLQENEESGDSHSNGISVASPEGSGATMANGEEARIKPKPFNFLVRAPRFDDESLREQIRLARLHVDEKTKLRDAIQVQIQEIRANSQIHGIDYEYAKAEGRGARKLVRSKRMEIDSLQSVINKAKNALSIEDIDSQIHNMEHMIQHETLPLKEEKQLIREIKQLKQLREQLSFNMGSQDEIKQALEQREEVEERLKILRKELDILKDKVLKAEAVAMEAEKKYDHENKKVKDLQAQFRAADDVRQAAYAQWQSLRKELLKKSKHFFKYKDDAAVASNYAFSRDTEALYRLCTNHVDDFMELWNTNDEFRREYVKFNARSTIRRFGTLDGRSVGPDEEPLAVPSYFDDRAGRMVSTPVKADLASEIPHPDLKQETTAESVTSDGELTKKVTEHENQKMTKKGPAIPVQVDGLDTDSGKESSDKVNEEPKKSKEEIEALRKAEEMRRKEAEAKLKEQRRLEELAKANEARERKKRQAEKQQMRAELKAQKEAEEKEKEKEKRLRKKERKKAAATDVNDIKNNNEPPQSSESAEEISKDTEMKDNMSSVKAKKAQKSWSTKQNKTKSVPPPLRNRNKRKWQQWMWVAITSLIIFVLFWLGNIGVFSNVNFRRRSPVH